MRSEPGEARSRGFAIHYEDLGNGEPVVLIPGLFMSSARWSRFGYIEELSKTQRVIAIDPLGHGESDKPTNPEAYLDQVAVADIEAVLDTVGIDRAHLWGYSRGAHHAHLFAQVHPDRVSSLATGGYSSVRPQVWPRTMPAVALLLEAGDWDSVFDLLGVADPAARKALSDNNPTVMAAVVHATALCQTPDFRRTAIPTFVYMGSLEPDNDVARKDAEDLGAQYLQVDGRDHGGCFAAVDVVLPEFRRFIGRHQRI